MALQVVLQEMLGKTEFAVLFLLNWKTQTEDFSLQGAANATIHVNPVQVLARASAHLARVFQDLLKMEIPVISALSQDVLAVK